MSTKRPAHTPAASAACPWDAPGGLPADLPLEEYPGTMLLRLGQAIQQEVAATYARSEGLAVIEWRLLARLNAESPTQLAHLCRALALDKPYASRILRSLEPQGLIKVSKDPDHGRRVIVGITRKGRGLARRLMPRVHASQQQLLQALDANERRVLYHSIRKLQAALPACSAQVARDCDAATSRRPQ